MVGRLISKLSWISAGHLLNAILGLVTLKVWTVYLTPSELGVMGLTMTMASIILGVFASPIGQSILAGYAAHSRAGSGQCYRAIVGRLLLRNVAAAVILILICGGALNRIAGLPWALPLLAAGFVVIDARRYFEQSLLAAAHRQREYAMNSVLDTGARLLFVSGALIFSEPNAISAIVGNLAGAAAFLALFLLTGRLEAYPGAVLSGHEHIRTQAVRTAKPLYLSIILLNISEASNRYIIGWLFGLEATGLFIAAYGLVKRPYGIVNEAMAMTFTPALSDARARESQSETSRFRRLWLLLAIGIAALGVLLFAVLGDLIVDILLSDEYSAADSLVVYLATAIAIGNIANVYVGFLLVAGRTREILLSNAVAGIGGFILTVALCLMFGLSGAAWALGLAYGAQILVLVSFASAKPFPLSFRCMSR